LKLKAIELNKEKAQEKKRKKKIRIPYSEVKKLPPETSYGKHEFH